MIKSFKTAALPPLVFARGALENISTFLGKYGPRTLLVSDLSAAHEDLVEDVMHQLSSAQKTLTLYGLDELEVTGPLDVEGYDLVISLGGARAIDLAKVSCADKPHVSLPATLGMGAALCERILSPNLAGFGPKGLPDLVIADASFLDGLERRERALRGLSVFVRLLESYISDDASVLADSLIWSGLEAFSHGFVAALDGDEAGLDQLFYASLMSGAGAAQAGFGLTHCIAQRLERSQACEYTQVCATLSFELLDLQIEALSERQPDSPALDKFAMCGELLAARPFEEREEAFASLSGTLRRWVARLEVGTLALSSDDVEQAVSEIMASAHDQTWASLIFREELTERILRRSRV